LITDDSNRPLKQLDWVMTGAAVARYLGISTERVRQICDTPGFPSYRRLGNARVFLREDIEKWARDTGRK
jgi:predicted DNA-binding transcriptional regulator AlpA